MENKKGFSLAEAMIMLTVISIIMAVSVPLIAKKTQIDTQTLFGHSTFNDGAGNNFSITSGGFGDNSRVGIGIRNALSKFHVRDSAAAANNAANNAKVIFQADTTNARAFKVFGDGSTNIRACVPDYANPINIAGNAAPTPLFNAESLTLAEQQTDGYIFVNNMCVSVGGNSACPPVILVNTTGASPTPVTTITFTSGVSPTLSPSTMTQAYSGNVLIPVSQDDTTGNNIAVSNDTATPLGLQFYGSSYGAAFIPCRTTSLR